jgi:hypothetical protein
MDEFKSTLRQLKGLFKEGVSANTRLHTELLYEKHRADQYTAYYERLRAENAFLLQHVRTCGLCGEVGHDRRKCEKRNHPYVR